MSKSLPALRHKILTGSGKDMGAKWGTNIEIFWNFLEKQFRQEILGNNSQNHKAQWSKTSNLRKCFLKCQYF